MESLATFLKNNFLDVKWMPWVVNEDSQLWLLEN